MEGLKRRSARICLVEAVLIGALGASCTGAIVEPGDEGSTLPGRDRAPGQPGPGETTPAACPTDLLPRRVIKLSDPQYANAVRDLLDSPGAALDVQTPGTSADAFLPSFEAQRVDFGLASQYQRAAESIGADASKRASRILTCPAATTRADACVRSWISSLVGRAFRRALTADEVQDYADLFEVGAAAGGSPNGVKLVVETFLQAPSFLYRTELGREPLGEKVALTDDEIAAALSFWLLDSPPDRTLQAAAAAGRLSDPAGLEAELDRLLALRAARDNVTQVFLRWFGIPELLRAAKDPRLFATFPSLAPSLVQSAQLFVSDVLWGAPGDVAGLYTSRAGFVDAKIAGVYGVPAPAAGEFRRLDPVSPQRAGIVTHPAVLARYASASESNVVHRGVFVLRELLCQPLGSPPADAQEAGKSCAGTTPRELAQCRADRPACGACHARIDPLGLVLESYDAIGRYRTALKGKAIDPAVTVIGTDFEGGLGGPLDLAERMGTSRQASTCVVSRMLSLAVSASLVPDSCTARALHTEFLSGGRKVETLLAGIGRSEAFRFRKK